MTNAAESNESANSESGSVSGPSSAKTPAGPLVPLCNISGDIDGRLLLGLLQAEGIGALATAELDPSSFPLGTSDAGSILVVEADLPRARRVLDEYRITTFAAGVILAAGEGARMGVPKGLIPIRGRRLIDELLETYSASLAREALVVVAPGSPLVDSLDGSLATIAVNRDPERGPLSSVWTALDELEESADAILLHPVDVPMFDSELIDELVRRYADGEGPILVPTFEGRRGHPVLFGKPCFELLRRASLDVGARQVLHDHPELVREVPTQIPWVTTDLNTPDELELFLRTYAPGNAAGG